MAKTAVGVGVCWVAAWVVRSVGGLGQTEMKSTSAIPTIPTRAPLERIRTAWGDTISA